MFVLCSFLGGLKMSRKVAIQVLGMSDQAFREAFATEDRCRTAPNRLYWRNGFVHPLLLALHS